MRRRISPSGIGAALAAVAALTACAQGETCPPYDVIERARAVDRTHVELTLACEVRGVSPETVSIVSFAEGGDGAALAVRSASGERVILLETDPQVGLATYTVKLDGVRGADGRRITASANFVGVGDLVTAPVVLRVDDRYEERLTEVYAQVTFDPDTGVFTHYSSRIALTDPDGDHVFTAETRVAVDTMRTVSTLDDRLGAERVAYAAKAVTADGAPLSRLVTFEVASTEPQAVALPLLSVPRPPGPEGLVNVRVEVDDTPARALTRPALRVSVDDEGEFDPSFPTTLPLTDANRDGVWEGLARVRIAPERVVGGTTSETYPYVLFIANDGTDYPNVGVEVEARDETDVTARIPVGNPALVPVTFRVDVSKAYLTPSGSRRGIFPGEAVYLTGEFTGAEDAFGQNASDAFSGGENVVLEMRERADAPGVWERTIFLGPNRPYGWKVVRCPKGQGCAELNRHVTSSGRAFATVMKNLATENRDAQTNPEVKIVDPRAPRVTIGSTAYDYSAATIYGGMGSGLEPDPSGTPDGMRLFKQEMPDLVVDVKTAPLFTPVVVVGTWRDVNLPKSLAEIVGQNGTFDLNPWDYDAGFVGVAPPSYELAPPPPPPPFVVGDGQADSGAKPVPGGTAGTMTLRAAVFGQTLYVATEDAGEGSDHFLFISAEAPTGAMPAPWAKAGTVAFSPSTIFLADEDGSDFAGWFHLGSATLLEAADGNTRPDLACAARGGVLEGTVDLAAIFGVVPEKVYVAVAPFASPDGGALYPSAQMPATRDGDGSIDMDEIATLSIADYEVLP